MYCSKCGTNLDKDDSFCPTCGNKIDNKKEDTKNEYLDNNEKKELDNKSKNLDVDKKKDKETSKDDSPIKKKEHEKISDEEKVKIDEATKIKIQEEVDKEINRRMNQSNNNSNNSDGLKVGSIVLGVIGILSCYCSIFTIAFPIAGLILGSKCKKKCGDVVGFVLNLVSLIFNILFTILFVFLIAVAVIYEDDDDNSKPIKDIDLTNETTSDYNYSYKNNKTQVIGDNDIGYLTIPSNFTLYKMNDGNNSLQYRYNNWTVSLNAFSNENFTIDEYSKSIANKFIIYGCTNISPEYLKIGTYNVVKFSGYLSKINSYMTVWTFQDSNNKIHYISLEGPDSTGDYYNIVNTFSLTK